MRNQTDWFISFWKFVGITMLAIFVIATGLYFFPGIVPSWMLIWGTNVSPVENFLFSVLVLLMAVAVLTALFGLMVLLNITPPAWFRAWSCRKGFHSFSANVIWPEDLRADYPKVECQWCHADVISQFGRNPGYERMLEVIHRREEEILRAQAKA